jgi:hypothetical protein
MAHLPSGDQKRFWCDPEGEEMRFSSVPQETAAGLLRKQTHEKILILRAHNMRAGAIVPLICSP